MKVYIILDNSKQCYDAGGIYHDCFQSREDAEQELDKFEEYDRNDFEIIEEDIGDLEDNKN